MRRLRENETNQPLTHVEQNTRELHKEKNLKKLKSVNAHLVNCFKNSEIPVYLHL